jgi:hypothetical protein
VNERNRPIEKGVFKLVCHDMSGDLVDDYFGVCPHCGKTDGYINIGRSHWMFCREHRVKWWIGSNIFSSWRYQTEAEQEAQYNALSFGDFRDLREEAT